VDGQDTPAARLVALQEQTTYARAFEAVMWALPVADTYAPRRAGNELGISPSALFITEQRPTGKLWIVTCNAQSPYVFGDLTTRNCPIVFEVPPTGDKAKFSGSIVDLWWLPLEDIGPDGADAGKGGKYLVLPPGYEGQVPDGYFVLRSRTYSINMLLRALPADHGDGGWAAAVAYARTLKIYPLAEAAAPKPVAFADVSRKPFPGTPQFDRSYFQYLDRLVQEEPVLEHDKAMMGLLASLGFEKGKPFRPDERTAIILDRAAQDVQRYCLDMFMTMKATMYGAPFWPDRHWAAIGLSREVVTGGAQWVFPDRLDYIARATFYYSGVGVQKRFGTQAIYPSTAVDANGNPLDGGKHYRIRLPKDVPVDDFWEVIAMSMLPSSLVVKAGFVDETAMRLASVSMKLRVTKL
jgi:hypothetical protein